MKWFKHMVDSLNDPDILEAQEIFGDIGYIVFFKTLEVMAREFDVKRPGYNDFTLKTFAKLLRKNPKSFLKVLSFFQEKNRIFFKKYTKDGVDRIKLNCPKLKKLCDEWTKKQIRKNSGVTPDKLRPIEEEEEEDKENIYKNNKKSAIPKQLVDLSNRGMVPAIFLEKSEERGFTDEEAKVYFENFTQFFWAKREVKKYWHKDWVLTWNRWLLREKSGKAKIRAVVNEKYGHTTRDTKQPSNEDEERRKWEEMRAKIATKARAQ